MCVCVLKYCKYAEILAIACFAKITTYRSSCNPVLFLWAFSGLLASMSLHLCSVAVLWVVTLCQRSMLFEHSCYSIVSVEIYSVE